MSSGPLFLGLELTTSHLIILLIDQKGNVIEQLQRSHGSLGVEQQPQDWWRAVRTGIKETLRRNNIDASQIRSLGITASTCAPILIDAEGKVLSPTFVGTDESMGDTLEPLTTRLGARNLQNIINQVPSGNSATAKLIYLKEAYPRAWHDAEAVMLPSSFLRFRLTGKRSIDAGSASETQLFNTQNSQWSKMLAKRMDMPESWLPSIGPGEQICGRVSEEAAKESGLASGTPVVQAGHRPSCISVAVNALKEDTAFLELNEYGNCYFPSDSFEKIENNSLACYRHGIKDTWLYTATDVASTQGINWLLDEISTSEKQQARRSRQNPIDKLSEVAAEVPPGAEGLIFIPPGNGMPGGFAGLELHHKHGHMIRAVFESGAMQLRHALSTFTKAHTAPSRFIITGAAAGNTLWCQIIADALETNVTSLPFEYPAALGAALLAGLCIGNFKSLNAASRAAKIRGQQFKPRKAASSTYQELEAQLAQLHEAMRAQMEGKR